MGYKEDYLLSEYQELGLLNDHEHVHLARNKINGKIVVIKEVSLLNREIYAYLKENPGEFTPKIYEIFEKGEKLIVIEEYISGNTLQEHVTQKLFPEEKAIALVKKICDGLEPFHLLDPPIITRDIKAENLILTDKENVKLIDFDIARTYKQGLKKDTCLMGSEGYAAPEQYGYRQTDQRTDIYAIGVLLNYLMTGRFPIEKMVDGALGQIVQKCIEMDPDSRYQSVMELKHALELLEGIQDSEQYLIREEQKNFFRKIPGFRSGKIWKMICAVFGYWFLTEVCMGLELETNGVALAGASLWMERWALWLAHLLYIGVVFDCFHKNNHIPLLRSRQFLLKGIGLILAYFVLISITVIACLIIESLFF